MKRLLALLIITIHFTAYAQDGYFKHRGYYREYTVHQPAGWDHKEEIPLLICLHGGGGHATQMQEFSGFDKIADERKFMVVYPNAWKHHWNDQREGCDDEAHHLNIDDVGFISALIDTLKSKHNLGKIYVTGISNGGMMTYKLACTLGNKISGIAPVAANMPENLYLAAPYTSPMKVLIINGTTDPLVPYMGGYVKVGRKTRGRVASTQQSTEFWLRANHCDTTQHDKNEIPDLNKEDGCNAYAVSYSGCGENAVVVITVVKGGHNMPGKKQYLPKTIIGNSCQDFNSAEKIAEFFDL